MNNLNEILENYKDGIPVNVKFDTVSVLLFAGAVALAGISIVLTKYLLK